MDKGRWSMKVLTSTKDLSREDWLRYRKQGIGGSDAGAICGVNPYASAAAVYADKTNPDVELQDNEAMRQGRDLEDYVAQRFTEATGLKVRRSNKMYQHDDYPFMIADIDRTIVGVNAGLECKTASAFSYDKWKQIETVPEHYIIQCCHYMAVMDWDYMYLACVILGKDFLYYRIERDEEMIRHLISIEKSFWEEYVMKKQLPPPDGSRDYDSLIGGDYFDPQKDSKIPLIGMDQELHRRADINQLITRLEKEKREIDQKLKLFMQDHEVAENERYKITWKYSETTGQRRFVVKEVA